MRVKYDRQTHVLHTACYTVLPLNTQVQTVYKSNSGRLYAVQSAQGNKIIHLLHTVHMATEIQLFTSTNCTTNTYFHFYIYFYVRNTNLLLRWIYSLFIINRWPLLRFSASCSVSATMHSSFYVQFSAGHLVFSWPRPPMMSQSLIRATCPSRHIFLLVSFVQMDLHKLHCYAFFSLFFHRLSQLSKMICC